MTRSTGKEGEVAHRFHIVLGSSTGSSMNYIVDIEKRSVVLHDTIVKSDSNPYLPDNDMISATIFYNNGTIASTSEGKIIHILNKISADAKPSLVAADKPALR